MAVITNFELGTLEKILILPSSGKMSAKSLWVDAAKMQQEK